MKQKTGKNVSRFVKGCLAANTSTSKQPPKTAESRQEWANESLHQEKEGFILDTEIYVSILHALLKRNRKTIQQMLQ